MKSIIVYPLEGTLTRRWQKSRILGSHNQDAFKLILSKTWETLLHSGTTNPASPTVPGIERKEWLKLLGINFHEDPCNWDLLNDSLLSRVRRLYILTICKYYGYSKDQLSKLFHSRSLMMSLFLYGLEVWASAYQRKYLDRIDTFFRRPYISFRLY